MASTGLYSQHRNNRGLLHLRNTLIALVLVIFAALALFPIFYMITSSFGPAVSTAGNMRTIFPKRWTLDSYVALISAPIPCAGSATALSPRSARCWAM